MKPLVLSLIFTVSLFLSAAQAEDVVKANNTSELNHGGSWVDGVVPGSGDVAVWNFTVTGANSALMGADLTWQGIRIDDPGGNVAIDGSNILTIGGSGISIGKHNLTLDVPTLFSADSKLLLNGNDRGVTFAKPADLGGHTLTVISNRDSRFLNGSGGLLNGKLKFTSEPHNGRVLFNAVSTGPFSLLATGYSHIIVNDQAASNPQLSIHLEDGSQLRLGVNFNGAAFEIGNLSGEAGTFVYPNYLATQKPVVRTLAVHQSVDGVFAGILADSNNNRALGLSKSGPASLELTNPLHEYSGATTVSEGRLRVSGDGRLNHRSGPQAPLNLGVYPGDIINDAILHFDSTAIQELSGKITGAGHLLKSNVGFLTLSGDGSSFVGNTSIQGGRFTLNGSLGGELTLAPNTSLGGTGEISGNVNTGDGCSLTLEGGETVKGLSVEGARIAGTTYIEFSSPQHDGLVYEVLNYGAGGLSGYENLAPLARGVLSHDTANQRVLFTAEAPALRTWDTGDGVWNSLKELQNWSEGDKLFYQGDAAVFDSIPSNTTVTLNGTLAPASVTVQHPSHILTFAGGDDGGFVGSGAFTKTSTGTLRIGAASPNFSGATSIAGGIFRLIEGGSWGTGPIANEASLEVETNSDLTLINEISGTGTLTKRGTGVFTLAGPAENTFTGDVVIEGGKVILAKSAALGIGNSGAKTVTVGEGAQLDFNGFAPTGRDFRRKEISYSFKIAGDGGGAGALINDGHKELTYFAGVLNLELIGDATVGGEVGFDIGCYFLGLSPTIAGQIAGNGHTLTKTGPNRINLRGPAANLKIIVKEGTLGAEGHNNALGGDDGLVTVHSGGILGARGAQNDPNDGPYTIPTPILFHDKTTLRDFRGNSACTWAGPVSLKGLLNVYTAERDIVISGIASGNGGLAKTGENVLTLSANNTYTGPTTVKEGTVIIKHPCLNDTSTVTVAKGARLKLDFKGTDAVGSLILGGEVLAPGIYNTSTHSDWLSSTGSLQVSENIN